MFTTPLTVGTRAGCDSALEHHAPYRENFWRAFRQHARSRLVDPASVTRDGEVRRPTACSLPVAISRPPRFLAHTFKAALALEAAARSMGCTQARAASLVAESILGSSDPSNGLARAEREYANLREAASALLEVRACLRTRARE